MNRQVNYQEEAPPVLSVGQGSRSAPSRSGPALQMIPTESVSQTLKLQSVNSRDFERFLREKLGKRCVPITNAQQKENVVQYQMKTADGTMLDIRFDHHAGVIHLLGSKSSVSAFLRIVQSVETRDSRPGMQTEMVPYRSINYRAVRRTISAIESGQEEMPDQGMNGYPNGNPMEFQNFPVENGQPGIGFASTPDPQALSATNAMLGQMNQAGLIGPVRIEVIDGLETIMIQGNRRDVAIVKELIAQIEKEGMEQEPEIVIYPMEHTDCTRLGVIVRHLYNEIYGTRRGGINITPLVKPNSLLLVGKKESIETAIELIKKLDLPVDPQHEFKIVRLKNASSDTVKSMLDEFYQSRTQLGTQVLSTSDYRTNSLIIQASPRDMQEVLAMVMKMDVEEGKAFADVKIFKLYNTSASDLATTLQNAITGSASGGTGFNAFSSNNRQGTRSTMLEFSSIDAQEGEVLRSGIITSDITITADSRGNSLIVKAPKKTMSLIAALIDELDQLPVARSDIKIFTIINGDASSLYTMLQTLFQTQTTTTTANSNTLTTLPGLQEGESSMVQLRFSVDVRTNSIIAVGSPGNLLTIEALLMNLDEGDLQNRNVSVFRLLNSPVSEVSTAINDYLRQERQIETIDNELIGIPEQFRREVVVVPESTTNSLIVSATPRYLEQIRHIIKELDDRPPMVVIQVLIAEVTLDNTDEFGVEWGLQDSILFDRSAGDPGFNFNTTDPLGNDVSVPNPGTVGTQGLTNLGLGRAGNSGYGGFVFSASSESVSVLLRALTERGKVSILCRPQITALDNYLAQISIGQDVPVSTGTSLSDGGTSQTQMDYRAVGVILSVTPRINSEGVVVMDIFVEKSKTVSGAGTDNPTFAMSQVSTMVSATDTQTVVIGGLIETEDETTTRGVPFISNIPVLGRLFEFSSKKCMRKEMLVILTPTIVRSTEDMESVKMQEIERIHWCVSDVMDITSAKNVRVRGDYYAPGESEYIIHTNEYIPREAQFPGIEETLKRNPYVPGAPEKAPRLPVEDSIPSGSSPQMQLQPEGFRGPLFFEQSPGVSPESQRGFDDHFSGGSVNRGHDGNRETPRNLRTPLPPMSERISTTATGDTNNRWAHERTENNAPSPARW